LERLSRAIVRANSTLVEFRLSAEGESTRLRVVERGFQRLDGSEEANARLAEDHLDGWSRELADLLEYAAEVHAQAPR
jgi:hypothetical protein